MNEQNVVPVTEKELSEKAVAPRVTQDKINELMGRVVYVKVQQPENTTATFIHAFLDGKFLLATGFSACVSKDNFNSDFGERIAHDKAKKLAEDKLWELEGYLLYVFLQDGEDNNAKCPTSL